MPGYIEEIEDIPKANYTEIEIEKLLKKLKVFKENEFSDLLHSCHNIIRNREKLDPAAAFDEIAKVLFMKVYAERNLKSDMKGNIFTLDYITNGENYNPDYLQDIFEKTKNEFGKDRIFAKEEKINLRKNTIKSIIGKLEKYNLSATSTDVKGIAFERFLGRTFRGEIGQFFTPRTIVDFMVKMVDPKENDVICDPASGSGGFLISFFEIIREKINLSIDKKYKKKKRIIESKGLSEKDKAEKLNKIYKDLQKEIDPKRKNSRTWKLANRFIYGTDANNRMARTSKMNMIMHGDGHGGIHHHDGFLNTNGIFENRFDIVLTNPPFGSKVEEDDIIIKSQIETDSSLIEKYMKSYGNGYKESQEKLNAFIGKPITSLFELPKSKSIKTEILFIERCINLLKEGGRLGIVLPEGILNNPNALYVRGYVEDKAYLSAVISLPKETFLSSGASVKASLIFLQKFTEQEHQKWLDTLKKRENEILEKQKDEREELELTIKKQTLKRNFINESVFKIESNKLKQEKKEARKQIKELDKHVKEEGRKKARIDFDYPIFMCEAENVGITSTGETGENIPNELPKILEQYSKFNENPKEFIKSINL